MIVFQNVCLQLGNVQILKNLNFSVEKGEFICLLGPSGCGKSTILRLIGDLLAGTSGMIRVAGGPPSEAWEKIAYVFNRICILGLPPPSHMFFLFFLFEYIYSAFRFRIK